MTKIICISTISIIDKIKESFENEKYSFINKPIIKIKIAELENNVLKTFKNYDSYIFQSKNSVISMRENIKYFNKRNNFFAVGKYTADMVENIFSTKCYYPKNKYSSHDLISEFNFHDISGQNIAIFKGSHGLSHIKDCLEAKNNVNELNVYVREIDINLLKDNDFDINKLNIVISMSNDALKAFIKKYKHKLKDYDVALIVPNKRFIIDECDMFRRIRIIDGLQDVGQYTKIIRELNNE